jgi:hypothetical protein
MIDKLPNSIKLNFDYEIKKTSEVYETITRIRRYYTMIEKLETVQCIEYIGGEANFADVNNLDPSLIQYKPHLTALYDFMIDNLEEVDDTEMWEHELFTKGLHIIPQ